MKIFDKVTPEFRKNFNDLVKEASSILITSHKSPDDDSISCVLSMYSYINYLSPEKKIDIYYSEKINQRWRCFKNFEKIKITNDITNIVNNYDLVIFLDQSIFTQFSEFPEKLRTKKFKSIAIDHHKNEPEDFDLLLLDQNASSATELIYYTFYDQETNIPKEICETLLLGILGDTGNLEYIKPSQAHIFSVVEKLVVTGDVNINELKAKYNYYELKVFEIVKEFIKNTTFKKVNNWPNVLISFIDREFIKQGKYTRIELSSASGIFISQYSRVIKDIPWGMVLSPKDKGKVGMSLRSNPGSINIQLMMKKMGIGGGHDRAGGGTFEEEGKELNTKDCIEKILKWMEENDPLL